VGLPAAKEKLPPGQPLLLQWLSARSALNEPGKKRRGMSCSLQFTPTKRLLLSLRQLLRVR